MYDWGRCANNWLVFGFIVLESIGYVFGEGSFPSQSQVLDVRFVVEKPLF